MSGSVNILDNDEIPALVVDVGSGMCKAGYAGDDAPKFLSPTVTGRPRYKHAMTAGMDIPDSFVGDRAQQMRNILALQYPVERGVVGDWDAMESYLHHMFMVELRAPASEHPCLFTEPPLNPKRNREEMCKIMFETFNTPGFYVALQPVLSLYSSGRGTGLLVDCGEGVTHTMPIWEGYAVRRAIKRLEYAGNDITTELQRLLYEREYGFLSTEHEAVRDMKEKLCYVADDYKEEMHKAACSSALESRYELPDGHVVTIGDERFRAVEGLFQPDLVERPEDGIQKMIFDSIMKTGIDMRKDFFCNVVLSGGSTMFPGFSERLQKELINIKSPFPTSGERRTKIITPPERKLSVWIGGSILASLSTFRSQWITSAEYDEEGPCMTHKKCQLIMSDECAIDELFH